HGTMTFAQVLQPAIEYAEEGFPISSIIAAQWKRREHFLRENENAASIYLFNGQAPAEGTFFKQPQLAKTLKLIAEKGRDVFYEGKIAHDISNYMERNGGLIRYEDLANHTSIWTDPIVTSYKGYRVYEIPPNSQGITTLEWLNILENIDFSGMQHNSSEYLHHLIEAKKLAYADRDRFVTDPN